MSKLLFNFKYKDDLHFGKDSDHKLIIRIIPESKFSKFVKWIGWKEYPIDNIRYKCLNCTNFNLCEKCYLMKENLKIEGATSNKNYHNFSALTLWIFIFIFFSILIIHSFIFNHNFYKKNT